MKALAILPGKAGSIELRDIAEPTPEANELLCELIALGVCGTDFEISRGQYGASPPGSEYLILGHESLGRVLKVPPKSPFRVGDLVVGFVRSPDPVPCAHCAVGEWDMCSNGLFEERGIQKRHGFGSERYVIDQDRCVSSPRELGLLGVLVEPASVVAKAWEHTLKIAARSIVKPQRALITGAGPVGLLAAMIGIQAGLEIHVFDHNTDGPKPELVKTLGATYHCDLKTVEAAGVKFNVFMECTGVTDVIYDLMTHLTPDGILCLTGVSNAGRNFATDIGKLNRDIVLQNQVIFGTVNANRRHYEAAVKALAAADPKWLRALINRKVPLSDWPEAYDHRKGDIKVVLVSADENKVERP